MGQQVPTIPVGQKAISTWQNKVSTAIPANRLAGSADFSVRSSQNGTVLVSKDSGIALGRVNDAGEYNALSNYGPNDLVSVYPNTVYTSSTGIVVSASVGSWICQAAVPDKEVSDQLKITFPGSLSASYVNYIRVDGVNYAPTWPEPTASVYDDINGKYWRKIGSFGGSDVTHCVISQLYGAVNYIGVRLTGSTTQFNIAKSIPSRCDPTSSFFGFNYKYSYTDDNTRLSLSGSSTEAQVMIPPFTISQSIFVSSCDKSGVTVSGTELTYIEHSTEREWCHPVGIVPSASVFLLTL